MLNDKKYITKKYLHFDSRIGIKNAESYVTDVEKISVHSFLPLIYYKLSFEKYHEYDKESYKREDGRPIKEKKREIMYSGHMDNYIYQYYAEALNSKYNNWVKNNNIDECATAYRNNKKGKSNINFSAEVINEVITMENCYIMIGDFEKFFDTLDHRTLKNKLMCILGVDYLSKDWYNVFKSVTKFSYYEKDWLEKKLGSAKKYKSNKEQKYFKTIEEYREFRKKNPVKKNRNFFGIPQGTAISAVLANVYTITFDKQVRELVSSYGGMYRRYSDDFVLIIPKKQKYRKLSVMDFKIIETKIYELINENKLRIQPEKTKIYEYNKSDLHCLSKNEKNQIDYLGFVFDGVNVKMREKSSYKFYRKAYKLIDRALEIKEQKGLKRLPYRKSIYRLYTDMGIKKKPHGNFLTYAQRAQMIFDRECTETNNMMMEQIKNRKKKIEKRMGVKIHI